MSAKNIEDAYPLSPAQEGMLFQTLLDGASGVYHTQFVCTLSNLDEPAFEQAWRQVVERHSILRSAFVWRSLERPLQVVGRTVALPVNREDWRGLASENVADSLDRYLRADRKNAFNPAKAPLMRLKLIQISEDEYKFIWSHHHLLLDGWSTFLLFTELLKLYEANRKGDGIELEPARPYRDYIKWLNQDLGEAEKYWRELLKDYVGRPLLIGERDEKAEAEGEYLQSEIKLSETLTRRLQEFARDNQLTLNTVVHGAWALLLSRWTRQRDVVYGVTVSGRPATMPGIDTMIGMFINTLLVRVQISKEDRVIPWLKQMQQQLLRLRQYEYSPLVKVQGWSEAGRGLFKSIVVFENYPVDEGLREWAGTIKISGVKSLENAGYPMVLLVQPGRELTVRVMYDASEVEADAVERMVNHLKVVFQGMIAGPAHRIDELPMLTERECEQIIGEWNDTAADHGEQRLLHELVERQVERSPEAEAVVEGDRKISYRELNQRAEELARYLVGRGAGPDKVIGVCLERGIELVVGLLGVLKSGAAYLPLDPSYPRQRLEYMVKDSGAGIVITERGLEDKIPDTGAEKVVLEERREEIAKPRKRGGRPGVSAENLAYVIYTSGSTGQPKGAANTHRGVVNRLLWMQQAYSLSSQDRVLQKTPMSFDVSVWEFFWPLISGAAVVMAKPGGHFDSKYLTEVIADQGVTVVHFVPAMLRKFLEEEGVSRCKRLRRVISSGEELSLELEKEFYRRMKRAELTNLYGPTEASIDVTYWDCAPPGRLLHELVERQVERSPEATAVVAGERNVSYGELNERADELASYLIAKGAGPDTVIGVCLEMGIDLVVALLGVLKSGAAYLPLDASYPAQRLEYILKDSGAVIVITQRGVEDKIPDTGAERVILEERREEIAKQGKNGGRAEVTGQNLAYVIYTSGSTGQPKGVMISHRAIVNHMNWMNSRYPLSEGDALLQKTSLSFDASVWEFYAALMSGAKVVMAKEGGQADTRYLIEEMRREEVTVVQAVPSMLRMLIEGGGLSRCSSLKTVYSGGEALEDGMVEEFYKEVEGARLVNLYGPTEASIDATYWECEKEIRGRVPIGRPIANTRIYILDEEKRIVPKGVPGEIYIAGDGLARGYIGKGRETAEKFIPDPYSGKEGERMYRSGDLGRYVREGEIEFLGRIDNQIKLRGYRIELGEIEEALRGAEGVEEAVAVVRGGEKEDERRIVGYVVKDRAAEKLEERELKRELRTRMPEYMVPARIVQLSEMPLSPNGKIDRKALPDPEGFAKSDDASYEEPSTPTEGMVAGIWGEVLSVEKVGRTENFFDLGGNSLLMVRVHTKIESAFKREIPLIDLFKYPSVSLLADFMDHAEEFHSDAPEQERASRRRDLIKRQKRMRQA